MNILWKKWKRVDYTEVEKTPSLKLPFKFILNTNKRCLVFATSSFILNMIFSSMLSIFELCQRKQGSCLVYIRKISDFNILHTTQDLEFIFRVLIRNQD
jgi:hypothetical protein